MSETATFFTCEIGPLDQDVAESTCVGALAPFAGGRVVDDKSNVLEQGQEGDVQFKTPTAMVRTFRSCSFPPLRTSSEFYHLLREQWLRLGSPNPFTSPVSMHKQER